LAAVGESPLFQGGLSEDLSKREIYMQIDPAVQAPVKTGNTVWQVFLKVMRGASQWSANVAIVFMFMLFLITCLDVFGSKLFNLPILGSQEIIGLLQGATFALAVGLAQLVGQHISVDLLTSKLSQRKQAVINSIVSLILLGVFAILVWQTFKLGLSIQESGQYTPTLRMPIHFTVYIMGIAFIVPCLVFLYELINSLKKVVKP
jgi:TRAP-type C4-dicarboxylate transport system permease small subunit